MKINRIKHQVDILCKMFVGWQLQEDFNTIAKNGNGTLIINTLNTTNEFNGKTINQLNMTKILSSWLKHDLIHNQIPTQEINQAQLKIKIEVKAPVYGDRFTNFTFTCNSEIITGNKTYSSSLKDSQDFECKKI